MRLRHWEHPDPWFARAPAAYGFIAIAFALGLCLRVWDQLRGRE